MCHSHVIIVYERRLCVICSLCLCGQGVYLLSVVYPRPGKEVLCHSQFILVKAMSLCWGDLAYGLFLVKFKR